MINSRDRAIKVTRRLGLSALFLALNACALDGNVRQHQPRPLIPPQIVYRIDDHRHFELTPDETCFGNMLYFVDSSKNIRSEVVISDAVMNRTNLMIDAANDQYLIAPVTRGGFNCSSGGGGCGERLPYSSDGGVTWQRAWYPGYGDDLLLRDSMAYRSFRIQTVHIDRLDLAEIPTPRNTNWVSVPTVELNPRISPMDTKVVCEPNDQELKNAR